MIVKSTIAALGVAVLLPCAVSALTVTAPSGTSYWVQNTSNQITWTYVNGDPDPVSLLVTNDNNTILNGAFSIAEFIPVSTQSFTVTNVTLVAGDNYKVNFVNGTNHSQIYASSAPFSVRASGTPPASVAPAATNPAGTGASATGTATGTGAGTGSGTATSTATSSSTSSAALSAVGSPLGLASLSAMMLGTIGAAVTFMF